MNPCGVLMLASSAAISGSQFAKYGSKIERPWPYACAADITKLKYRF